MSTEREDVVRYIQRYGGFCRDCADENGVCPSSGLPCAGAEKAIRHVLSALDYGIKHGYLPAAQAAAVKVPADLWDRPGPQVTEPEHGPEPTLREVIRGYYTAHDMSKADAERCTEQYIAAATANTPGDSHA